MKLGRAASPPRLDTATDPTIPLRLRGPVFQSARLCPAHILVLKWASVCNGPCFKVYEHTTQSGTRLPTCCLHIHVNPEDGSNMFTRNVGNPYQTTRRRRQNNTFWNFTTLAEPEAISLGVKRPGLLSTVELNEWNYTNTPYAFVGWRGSRLTFL